MRIFPRFVAGDPLVHRMDNFCWDFKLMMDLNYNEDPSSPTYIIQETINKRKILKNITFLEILDMRHSRDVFASFPDIFSIKQQGLLSHAKRTSDGAPYHPKETRLTEEIDLPFQEIINEELWNSFERGNFQDLLDNTSDIFISEYIQLSSATHFTYNDAWNLKQYYLKKIYDYIVSRKKRSKIKREISKSNKKLMDEIDNEYPPLKSIISSDKAIYDLKKRLVNYATYNGGPIDILILGARGTGKELFAKAYHEISRPGKPFIVQNCSAIPENLFESTFFGYKKGAFTGATDNNKGLIKEAEGGTIFLDEFGALDQKFQPKLLRLLQDREIQPTGGKPESVDIQIILATNENMLEMMRNGKLREDLFDRIKTFRLDIPPLRKRKNDIPLLIEHFLKTYCIEFSIDKSEMPKLTDDCLDTLKNYSWPGNVRDLENEIHRMVVEKSGKTDKQIKVSDLSSYILNPSTKTKDKPRAINGKKKHPGNDQLMLLVNEGLNNEEIAKRIGVARETVNRWLNDIPEYRQIRGLPPK